MAHNGSLSKNSCKQCKEVETHLKAPSIRNTSINITNDFGNNDGRNQSPTNSARSVSRLSGANCSLKETQNQFKRYDYNNYGNNSWESVGSAKVTYAGVVKHENTNKSSGGRVVNQNQNTVYQQQTSVNVAQNNGNLRSLAPHRQNYYNSNVSVNDAESYDMYHEVYIKVQSLVPTPDTDPLLLLMVKFIGLNKQFPFNIHQTAIEFGRVFKQKSDLVEEEYNRLLNYLHKFWRQINYILPEHDLTLTKKKISNALNPLSNENFKSSGHCLHNYKNLVKIAENLQKYNTWIGEYTDAQIFCMRVDDISIKCNALRTQEDVKDLKTIIETVKCLKFDKKLGNKFFNDKVQAQERQRRIILEDLVKKENVEQINEIQKELCDINEKILDVKTNEELQKINTQNTSLLSKLSSFYKTWNNRSWLKKSYVNDAIVVAQTTAEGNTKMILAVQKILNEDNDLIKLCHDAMKCDSRPVESGDLISDICNRITFYHNYQIEDYQQALNGLISDKIKKLEEISSDLHENLYLDEERVNQENLCSEADNFWGNLSSLDDLMRAIKKIQKNINILNVSSTLLRTKKEKLLNKLGNTSKGLEVLRPVIQVKEEILAPINIKIVEVEKAVNAVKGLNSISSEELNMGANKIKEIKNDATILLQSIQKIKAPENDRLNAEIKVSKEKLQKLGVNLEMIELEYDTKISAVIEEDELFEDDLNEMDQLKVTPNLTFLSDVILSLRKILHQSNHIQFQDINIVNLLAELEDKKDLVMHFKCDPKEEKVKETVLIVCNMIKESNTPEEKYKSNIIEEIKLESIKATHYYTEIVSASHNIEKTKASIMENRILKIMSNLDKLDVGYEKDTLRETRKDILHLCNQSLSDLIK